MDKTHTKMGKARPWMLWTQIGNCICLVLLFSVPMGMGQTAQYAYFFVTYVLLNVIFYTANNIAYASLTSLITKNTNERVQMGSIRFMFSLGTNVAVSSVTVGLTNTLGGGAAGWRNVAIIYAIISLIVNTISVFSVKELSPEELSEGTTANMDEKVPFVESLKLLAKNKYFIMIAIFCGNAGGAWDNGKKYIETGGIPGAGKGSRPQIQKAGRCPAVFATSIAHFGGL